MGLQSWTRLRRGATDSHSKLSAGEHTLWCHLSPSVQDRKMYCCWDHAWPCLSHGNSGNQPGYALGIVFRKPLVYILWCRSDTETSGVAHLDLLGELLSQPGPYPHLVVCRLTEPAAGPFLAMESPVFCSEVLQALSLQCHVLCVNPWIPQSLQHSNFGTASEVAGSL